MLKPSMEFKEKKVKEGDREQRGASSPG